MRITEELHRELQSRWEAGVPSLGERQRLRKTHSAQEVDLLCESLQGAKKSTNKFGPGVWWSTVRGCMQATHRQVADLKAGWLGDRLVYDLCCGIGGDSISLARRGPLVSVDYDPVIQAIAERNVNSSGGLTQGLCRDVTQLSFDCESGLHIDPDRRPDNRRTSHVEGFQPNWADVLKMIQSVEAAVVKVAPASCMAEAANDLECRRLWISLTRTVREQCLLTGDAIDQAGMRAYKHAAVILRNDQPAVWFRGENESKDNPIRSRETPGDVMFDPDAAIRAAGLTETLAQRFDLHLLGSASGFLTGDGNQSLLETLRPLGVVANVVWSGSFDDRRIRRELRSLGAHARAVKIRSVDADPAVLCKRYRPCGERPLTLWLGRTHRMSYAVLTD
ncbi:MAG: class I SAM-dependent methyltransferase [Planctomycetota bacterium]